MDAPPAAFMSYVNFDDTHEEGRLTEFCRRLSGEVRMQTGEESCIFQDRKDIDWGQQWQHRIDESLDAATFLIAIITPSFFKSKACRNELERFLDREAKLRRGDLILPVYYLDCPILNIEAKRETDAMAKVIAARQFADWRELRFEPFTSPQVGKMLQKMATQIVEALERGLPASLPAPSAVPTAAAEKLVDQNAQDISEPSRGPTRKTEPPTHVVDAFHRGDHVTLTAALMAAKPGDRILVRPGLYKEGIVIDKPVEIIGDGTLGEVVIEATGKNAVLFQANMGRIANLTLRQAGGGECCCIDIAQGRLDLEGSDVTSQSFACVAIHGGADPRLPRNRIHDGKEAGVYVYENGQGTLEDNEIFANEAAGVQIRTGGNPSLRRNRIHDGKDAGVYVYENGQGTLEDNEIFANALTGVEIQRGGNPTLAPQPSLDERL
jgi:parallel beta-helix repeat protein